jgi:transposase
MSLFWYGNQTQAEGRNLGSLALIAPLIERMKLADIINQHLPTDPRADFDHGRVLSLLVAARLYNPVALMNVGTWAREAGADLLWGMPPEKINDDRLGRSLAAFFKQRHSILGSLALSIAQEFDLPLNQLHYDPTHILLHGAYEDSQPGELPAGEIVPSDEDRSAAHITKGRAMEDVPDGTHMIHLGMTTFVDELGPQPLFGHTIDGNQNGHTAVAQGLPLLQKHLRLNDTVMISDRGTFSAVHLGRVQRAGMHALCSVPWDDVKELFDKQRKKLKWKKASYLSQEQQRRRRQGNLPKEHYELSVASHEMTDTTTKEKIPVRVIFVYSTADRKAVRKQRARQIEKIREGLEKVQATVARGGPYSDPVSIARRVGKLFGSKQASRYFQYEMIPLSKQEQASLARKSGLGPKHRFEFTFDEAAQKQDEPHDGISALVTTVPKHRDSADSLFSKFKNQIYCEHANSQLKGPLAVHPVFLKNPERVEALVCLLMISLMLYFVLQRMYRGSVVEEAAAKEKRTTTRTLLREFAVYTVLLHRTSFGFQVQPTALTRRQREILQQLRLCTPAQILSRRLPRPPD